MPTQAGSGSKSFSIGPKTKWGGLIGQGITHTLSPFIHNTSAKLLGLDCVYLPIDLLSAPNMAFFDALLGSNVYGFNVTLPFKEDVAKLFPGTGLLSCNTLTLSENGWVAASTDAEGFLLGLKELNKSLEGFDAIICLGYGGAAKALCSSFSIKVPNCPQFVLMRSPSPDLPQALPFTLNALSDLLKKYPNSLLIQCTSAPLKGDNLSALTPALEHLQGAFVDLVYGTPSALFFEAQRRKIPSQDGLAMLLGQALASQKLWWGQSADYSTLKLSLEQEVRARK